MGTRFMATVEAEIHENIKKALVEGGAGSTTLVMRSVRNTERVYKNEVRRSEKLTFNASLLTQSYSLRSSFVIDGDEG